MSSLDKAISVLGLLGKSRPVLRVGEVSRTLGLQKSTVSRLLATLAEGGLLAREANGLGYVAGARGLALAELYLARHTLLDLLEKVVDRLVVEFGFVGYVSVLDGAELVILRRKYGTYPLRLGREVGQRVAAFETAVGRALLSRRPEHEAVAILAADPALAQNLSDARAELVQGRRLGFVSSLSTITPGVAATAAAVANPATGEMLGFSLSFPVAATDHAMRTRIAGRVREEAAGVGLRLGDRFWVERGGEGDIPDVSPTLAAGMSPHVDQTLTAG